MIDSQDEHPCRVSAWPAIGRWSEELWVNLAVLVTLGCRPQDSIAKVEVNHHERLHVLWENVVVGLEDRQKEVK